MYSTCLCVRVCVLCKCMLHIAWPTLKVFLHGIELSDWIILWVRFNISCRGRAYYQTYWYSCHSHARLRTCPEQFKILRDMLEFISLILQGWVSRAWRRKLSWRSSTKARKWNSLQWLTALNTAPVVNSLGSSAFRIKPSWSDSRTRNVSFTLT